MLKLTCAPFMGHGAGDRYMVSSYTFLFYEL